MYVWMWTFMKRTFQSLNQNLYSAP